MYSGQAHGCVQTLGLAVQVLFGTGITAQLVFHLMSDLCLVRVHCMHHKAADLYFTGSFKCALLRANMFIYCHSDTLYIPYLAVRVLTLKSFAHPSFSV